MVSPIPGTRYPDHPVFWPNPPRLLRIQYPWRAGAGKLEQEEGTTTGRDVVAKDVSELAAVVERHTGADGDFETAIPGLWHYRSPTPSEEHPVVSVPSLCVVTQGAKEVAVGGETYRYDPAQSLLVSVDMPALTHVADATADRPCLAIRIPIDPAVVGELLAAGLA